jgi:hypothetical protein
MPPAHEADALGFAAKNRGNLTSNSGVEEEIPSFEKGALMVKLLTVAALAAALVVPAASAKDGAQAHLLAPLPAHARAGMLVTVRWTVTVIGSHGERTPFGATGMFATLIGANGATKSVTAKQNRPPFSVRIRVPAGGIHRIKLGLHSFSSTPTGTHEAPWYLPIR